MEQGNSAKGPKNREHETTPERPHLSSPRQPMDSPHPSLLSLSLAGNFFLVSCFGGFHGV